MSSYNWSEIRDSELVEACLNGHQKAYGELVDRYRDIIYALAVKRTGNAEAARDITQDVLIDAYVGLPNLREPAKFGQYRFQSFDMRLLGRVLNSINQYADAVTVDLKGFTQKAYDNSSAQLEPVLKTLETIKQSGTWLEVVNLVIPTINDDMEDIRRMCQWIKEKLGEGTPVHYSRFFPNYKLTNLSPTPIKTLEKARDVAMDVGLHYVSIGNAPGHKYNSTFCPKCEKWLIHRSHFQVLDISVEGGRCKFCGHEIPGIWQ